MASLSGMTLAEMRAATATQIRNPMKNRLDTLTKAQLMRLELWVREWEPSATIPVPDKAATTYAADGQIASREVITRDVLGAIAKTIRHQWAYYPAGREVDTITRIELDAGGGEVSRRTIKHFTDGRQPIEV